MKPEEKEYITSKIKSALQSINVPENITITLIDIRGTKTNIDVFIKIKNIKKEAIFSCRANYVDGILILDNVIDTTISKIIKEL